MSATKAKGARGVLVTGGSRGLGLAIAQKLAAGGYRTIAVARTESKEITAAIAHAERAGQGTLHFVPFDLGKIDNIPALVRKLRKEFGALYGLINNAALGLSGTLAMMHNSKLEEMVRVNTLSPIVLTKYVVRSMMADGDGRIVNVASIVAFTGASGVPAYAATKASMLGFTRSLAREVGPLGIRQRRGARHSRYRHDACVDRRAARADRATERAQPPHRSRGRGQRRRVPAQRQGTQHYRHDADRGRRRHGLACHRSVTRINSPLASR